MFWSIRDPCLVEYYDDKDNLCFIPVVRHDIPVQLQQPHNLQHPPNVQRLSNFQLQQQQQQQQQQPQNHGRYNKQKHQATSKTNLNDVGSAHSRPPLVRHRRMSLPVDRRTGSSSQLPHSAVSRSTAAASAAHLYSNVTSCINNNGIGNNNNSDNSEENDYDNNCSVDNIKENIYEEIDGSLKPTSKLKIEVSIYNGEWPMNSWLE